MRPREKAVYIARIKRAYWAAKLPRCPRCGETMRWCHGPYKPFLGCSQYPDCTGTLPGWRAYPRDESGPAPTG
jgi:ssDNA-binding Zn-finger/Zn-ribbon topoisomerase 1